MGERQRRWRSLDLRQRRQLVLLAILLPLSGLMLSVFGMARSVRCFDRLAGQRAMREPTEHDLAEARDLARLARIAGRRGPVAASCLRQSLVVRAWLRRRGLDAQLRIGVRKAGEALDAHAWVEVAGVALEDLEAGHVAFPAGDLGATGQGSRAG